MPLVAERPIVSVEHGAMHTIETRNPENLFGLWSVFSKCSLAMQDGKRYENLAWRLWSRETFCCQPDHLAPPRWSLERQLPVADELPELSSSVGSDDSMAESGAVSATTRSVNSSRPELRRHDSANSQARGKHMTPIDLEKVVNSIQEKRAIEPLSPLPAQLAPQPPACARIGRPQSTARPASPPPSVTCTTATTTSTTSAPRFVPESSTSTLATAMGSSCFAPLVGSDESASTDISTHSVVHGFDPSRISTSVRSSTNLNPTPILKNGFAAKPLPTRADAKKKAAVFTLGGSSEEENSSSLEASYSLAKRTSHLDHDKPSIRKTASFKHEVSTRLIPEAMSEESDGAIESGSEDESDDNAIEEEDSDEEWEDDNEESGPPSFDEVPSFQRVDSKPNLVSRRSLLTTMMHQGDRAQALQNAASRSSPAIRRSRTATPNGPSTGTSPQPQEEGLMMRPQASRAKPIIMTTSNVHPPALSPRTTRRNMLQTELTQSLRQNLLWERQQKNATTNAVNRRVQSAVSVPALRRAMTTSNIPELQQPAPQQQQQQLPYRTGRQVAFRDATRGNSSYNDYFDQGLQDYHQKGW